MKDEYLGRTRWVRVSVTVPGTKLSHQLGERKEYNGTAIASKMQKTLEEKFPDLPHVDVHVIPGSYGWSFHIHSDHFDEAGQLARVTREVADIFEKLVAEYEPRALNRK